jgi:hypothetical protein
MERSEEVETTEAYELLLERLHEIADALAELDAGSGALARSSVRRRLAREQAYLLSAVAGLDGAEQSLN